MVDPVDILARTLGGEARGCGLEGMRHVAMVILNRAKYPRWWGHDIVTVCQKPWQFSCWNINDPNRHVIMSATIEQLWFRQALTVAQEVMDRTIGDITCHADSYYARSMAHPPSWASPATLTFRDEWHAFHRLELPPA